MKTLVIAISLWAIWHIISRLFWNQYYNVPYIYFEGLRQKNCPPSILTTVFNLPILGELLLFSLFLWRLIFPTKIPEIPKE